MRIKVEVPKAEFTILQKIGHLLGLSTQELIQQEVDASLATISVWLQRADLLK
jgi:hypothetical protein